MKSLRTEEEKIDPFHNENHNNKIVISAQTSGPQRLITSKKHSPMTKMILAFWDFSPNNRSRQIKAHTALLPRPLELGPTCGVPAAPPELRLSPEAQPGPLYFTSPPMFCPLPQSCTAQHCTQVESPRRLFLCLSHTPVLTLHPWFLPDVGSLNL